MAYFNSPILPIIVCRVGNRLKNLDHEFQKIKVKFTYYMKILVTIKIIQNDKIEIENKLISGDLSVSKILFEFEKKNQNLLLMFEIGKVSQIDLVPCFLEFVNQNLAYFQSKETI